MEAFFWLLAFIPEEEALLQGELAELLLCCPLLAALECRIGQLEPPQIRNVLPLRQLPVQRLIVYQMFVCLTR